MTDFERYIAEYALTRIDAITRNPRLTPYQLGEITGWQRVRTLVSMTQAKFSVRLVWGERIILQNEPSEFEMGIAHTYLIARTDLVNDYFRIRKR